MKHVSGFTLIELLISMSLLSMIMLLANWSFSMFLDRWEGRLGDFSKTVSDSKDLIILNNMVSSISPFIIKSNNSTGYFFTLKNNEIKAVSQNGVFFSSGPVYFKLSVKQQSNNEQYLLYQEGALTGNTLSTDELTYSHEKVLIDNAREINLQVLSWSSIFEKINSQNAIINNNTKLQWREKYNALQSNIMPISVRVTWNNSSFDIALLNDEGQLLSQYSQSRDTGINE